VRYFSWAESGLLSEAQRSAEEMKLLQNIGCLLIALLILLPLWALTLPFAAYCAWKRRKRRKEAHFLYADET
jgi:hypothetical protein